MAVVDPNAAARQPWMARIARAIRTVVGAPDYGAYRERLARDPACHVELAAREFVQRKLEERYARPGSRCC
jgi:uncharacterized short protein YbdD (DUF466 family)